MILSDTFNIPHHVLLWQKLRTNIAAEEAYNVILVLSCGSFIRSPCPTKECDLRPYVFVKQLLTIEERFEYNVKFIPQPETLLAKFTTYNEVVVDLRYPGEEENGMLRSL